MNANEICNVVLVELNAHLIITTDLGMPKIKTKDVEGYSSLNWITMNDHNISMIIYNDRSISPEVRVIYHRIPVVCCKLFNNNSMIQVNSRI